MNQRAAVVIMTCDAFSDAWTPFFGMFFKYWPNCPYEIYLCGESLVFDHPRVQNISLGNGIEWSARLLKALDSIPQEYLLFMLEDYVLLKPVNTMEVERHLDIMLELDAAYLRLIPAPPPDESIPDYPGIGLILPGSAYRNSTQAAFWKKQKLRDLLDPTETIWDFELAGVHRTNQFSEPFLSVEPDMNNSPAETGDYPLVYFCTAISRGKWLREAVRLIKRNGFEVDLDARHQESLPETFRRFVTRKYPSLVARMISRHSQQN